MGHSGRYWTADEIPGSRASYCSRRHTASLAATAAGRAAQRRASAGAVRAALTCGTFLDGAAAGSSPAIWSASSVVVDLGSQSVAGIGQAGVDLACAMAQGVGGEFGYDEFSKLCLFAEPPRGESLADRPLSSWVTALLAVLDSAALFLALSPNSAPVVPARLCLRGGFVLQPDRAGDGPRGSRGARSQPRNQPELPGVPRRDRPDARGRLSHRTRPRRRVGRFRRLAGQLRAGRLRGSRRRRRGAGPVAGPPPARPSSHPPIRPPLGRSAK